MSVIPQPIGLSVEAKLLYEILKKLDAILTGSIKVNVTNPDTTPVNVTIIP
jgi:hypothetical protein